MKEEEFEFEIYKDEYGQYYLMISGFNSTGVQYRIEDYADVGKKIQKYLEEYYSED